jgi:hypothetical protein
MNVKKCVKEIIKHIKLIRVRQKMKEAPPPKITKSFIFSEVVE